MKCLRCMHCKVVLVHCATTISLSHTEYSPGRLSVCYHRMGILVGRWEVPPVRQKCLVSDSAYYLDREISFHFYFNLFSRLPAIVDFPNSYQLFFRLKFPIRIIIHFSKSNDSKRDKTWVLLVPSHGPGLSQEMGGARADNYVTRRTGIR